MEDSIERVKSCAEEVARELGPGYREGPYEEALAHEFRLCDVPYERQKNYEVIYKGHCIGTGRIDLVVDGSLIVECKAVKSLSSRHRDQLRAYYETTELGSGILLNFPRHGGEVGVEKVSYPSERELEEGGDTGRDLPEVLRGVKAAADEVCRVLGTEFAYRGDEGIYENALKVEFRGREIPYTERRSELLYKNQVLDDFDAFIVDGRYLIVMGFDEEMPEDLREDVEADLRLHDLDEGLIINFPPESMKVEVDTVKI